MPSDLQTWSGPCPNDIIDVCPGLWWPPCGNSVPHFLYKSASRGSPLIFVMCYTLLLFLILYYHSCHMTTRARFACHTRIRLPAAQSNCSRIKTLRSGHFCCIKSLMGLKGKIRIEAESWRTDHYMGQINSWHTAAFTMHGSVGGPEPCVVISCHLWVAIFYGSLQNVVVARPGRLRGSRHAIQVSHCHILSLMLVPFIWHFTTIYVTILLFLSCNVYLYVIALRCHIIAIDM